MPFSAAYRPDPRWLELGEGHHDVVQAARFPRLVPRWRHRRAAAEIGLDTLDDEEWSRHLARLEVLPDNLPAPLALRYHGHQFRSYNPQLGDGRGFLLAQLRDREGRLMDLGTKGSGTTPWSRGGDGRLTLKGGVREVLASELLDALGVGTCRILSLYETGEALERHDEPSPTRASILVRLSHSHVRFGTFQRHAFLRRDDLGRALLEYTIAHLVPEARPAAEGGTAEGEGPVERLLDAVVSRSARTVAGWIAAGFVHGVLNTDNMNVTGESFDYGPWRFAVRSDPSFTAAYFDHQGLYAYGRQAEAVLWNLERLAEALEPLDRAARLLPILERYVDRFEHEARAAICRRLGVEPRGSEADQALMEAVFGFLRGRALPLERLFFDWYGGEASRARALSGPARSHYEDAAFRPLAEALADRAPSRPEALAAPYFAREAPVTLWIDEVEALWARIATGDDWSAFEGKLAAIAELRRALGPTAHEDTDNPTSGG
jgi:uncharacterized protein YdiU (UPF0061 family)